MYTEGDSITVKGVKCDFVRCNLSERSDYEKKGYTCNILDLDENAKRETQEQKAIESEIAEQVERDRLQAAEDARIAQENAVLETEKAELEQLEADIKDQELAEKDESTKKDSERQELNDLTNDEIRALAQDANIENYQTKRIETLKKELDI